MHKGRDGDPGRRGSFTEPEKKGEKGGGKNRDAKPGGMHHEVNLREGIRINKFLSEAGVCSRREADRLVLEGRVFVDGRVAQVGELVGRESLVELGGRRVTLGQRPVLLLLNKPVGVVCSTRHQGEDTTVMDLLRYPARVFPVGRLDKDSEGLLLLTNQGELSDSLMRGSNYHEKEYLVTVDHPIQGDFLKRMGSGVPILGTMTRPCRIEKLGRNRFRIVLTQGLNRQIRRMCEYLGYQVVSLKRVRICNLGLGSLLPGQYREATAEEWEALREELRGEGTY